MKYYEQMIENSCFTFSDAIKMTGSEPSAISILNQYVKKGYITKIRRGLYSAINMYDHEPIANRFEIASALSNTAVVSHHSAFDYYGYSNQVSYKVNVTSETKFNTFTFGNYTYFRHAPSISLGVIKIGNNLSVTDLERTVLDSINDFESDMGFEELIQCIKAIPTLDEGKLAKYLVKYDKSFLYQKVGFILEHFQSELSISKDFLDFCKASYNSSSRYLIKDMSKNDSCFSSNWHLTIPKNLWKKMDGEIDNDNI